VNYDGTGRIPVNATNLISPLNSNSLTNFTVFWNATDRSSNVVDVAQTQPLFINSKIEPVDATELTLQTLANDNLASATARYYTKIVSVTKPAANISVKLDAKLPPATRVYVFGKFKGTDTTGSIEDQPYVRLTAVSELSSDQAVGEVETVTNNYSAPVSSGSAISDTGLFTEYKLKIILSNTGANKRLPEISGISAVPLGRKNQAQFFQTITPSGSVLPYAGKFDPPEGFLLCDGQTYQKDDFLQLYEVLGGVDNPYNTDASIDTATQFQVPDMQGRVPVGSGTSLAVTRTFGDTGGSPKLQGHRHHLLSSGGGGNLSEGRSFAEASNTDKNRSIAPGISEGSAATANDKYKLGTALDVTLQKEAAFAISSNPIDNTDYTPNSDETLTEQMPPFVVTRYIIKI